MSLYRRDLRQIVVGLLCNFDKAPYPTIAGPNVFDSKGDAIQNVSGQNQMATVLVYTDTESRKLSTIMNAPEWEAEVQLVIEIAVSNDSSEDQTNSEIEAKLDLLEQQVNDVLFNQFSPTSKASTFRRYYTKIGDYKSLRMGNNESNNRLAMRGIVIDVALKPGSKQCTDPTEIFPELKTFRTYSDYGDDQLSVISLD